MSSEHLTRAVELANLGESEVEVKASLDAYAKEQRDKVIKIIRTKRLKEIPKATLAWSATCAVLAAGASLFLEGVDPVFFAEFAGIIGAFVTAGIGMTQTGKIKKDTLKELSEVLARDAKTILDFVGEKRKHLN